MVQVRLFGGVNATDERRAIDLGPAKRRAVLAALALSAGAAVPVPRIVELVWGADPPRTAEKTLQAHIARLRSMLGRDTITRVGAAYLLDLPSGAVDVLRFQRRLDTGDIEGALDEWTGTPLAGLDADGFNATVDRLVEQWLGATEAQLAQLIATDPAAAVGPLTELTAAHPFREELWAMLMTALYRVGRQADALAAYRTVRRQLDEQLGIEPGARLRDLEAAILSHDDRLVAMHDVAYANRSDPSGDGRGNLPARRPQLVGRDQDRRAVHDALAAAPVVTLVGPGGIGKTQLALAVAYEAADGWPDGVWLVELAPVSSPADVPRVVADTLGVIERPGQTITASIVTALHDRRSLVVIDNCEQVIGAAAAVAATMGAGCANVQVLATSRQRLGIDHEHVVAVPPLAPGPGAQLFIGRAAAAAAATDVTTDLPVVERICRRLDGVPLAIELAAARTSVLAPAELLARLDDALRVLADGRRDDVAHHRTLRATIRWSYDLLGPSERTVLQRLSIFAGAFDLPAAEAVATGGGLDETDVAVQVGRLVDQSMVLVEPDRDGRRFRLLDTVRRFAAEQLADAGATDVLADRHARWSADAVANIGQLLAGPDELTGVARLAAIWPNLRAASDHAHTTGDRGLADALLRPIVGEIILRSHIEIGDWVERLLDITPADDEAVAIGLGWAAQRYAITQDPDGFDRLAARHGPPDHVLVRHACAFPHDDYPALADLGPQAVDELHRQGQHHLAELAEPDRGVALLNLGRLDEAETHLGPLIDRYRAQGPPTLLNWTLMLLGYTATFRGDQRRAEELFEAAVDVAVPPRTHSPNRTIEARIAWRRGKRARAVELLRTGVDELLATGNMQAASLVAVELVTILTTVGRSAEAARLLGYLQATHLLDAPGFAALVADSAAVLTNDPALDADLAAGHGLDDRAALTEMRTLLATLN